MVARHMMLSWSMVSMISVLTALQAGARDDWSDDGLALHGPILQWSDDPATTMTITWVERALPPAPELHTWYIGRGGFGYDFDRINTHLDDMRGRETIVAIRRGFDLDLKSIDPSARLVLEVYSDDAFICWINGREVARVGVTGRGAAARDVVLHEADRFERFDLDGWRTLLHADVANMIALEGHNAALDSSDFALVARLLLLVDGATEPTIVVPYEGHWQFMVGAPTEEDWISRLADGVPRLDPARRVEPAPRVGPLTVVGADGGATTEWAVETTPFADTTALLRRVHLTGLAPNTEYVFTLPDASRVCRNVLADGRSRFRTAPAELERGETLVFVTGGDMYHRRNLLDRMNRRAGAEDAHFALLGGDLAYADGRNEQRWFDWIDSWARNALRPDGTVLPMIVAIGNHETGSGLDPERARALGLHPHAKFFYSLFRLPAGTSNYAIDFGDWMSLILLDSNETQSVESQTPWLRRSLSARADGRRTFICYHKPGFGTNVKEDIAEIRDEWGPVFEEFGVDAVFENDHHVYKRTLPIRAGAVDEENGVLYLGDGAWGVVVREIPDYSEKPWIAHAASVNHLIRVEVSREQVRYQAKRADGTVFDSCERK